MKALQSSISRLLHDKELYERLIYHGYEQVDELYSFDAMVDQLEATLDEVVHKV